MAHLYSLPGCLSSALSAEGGSFCLEGHSDSVGSVAFSFDGKYLATGGLDGAVRVWTTEGQPRLLFALEGPAKEVEWLQWHPRGYALLAGRKVAPPPSINVGGA